MLLGLFKMKNNPVDTEDDTEIFKTDLWEQMKYKMNKQISNT